MGVRLTDDEAWAELAAAHTGILTTLRRDGRPVPLPVWFAAVDRAIYVRTPARTHKVEHVRRDPRATFLVERGERWAELCAVMVHADVTVLDAGEERDAVEAAMAAKYASFRTEDAHLPDATRAHYAVESAVLKLTPVGRLVTWDNSKLRLQ
ncbi:MAG TPA: pyridoxamine 5'-phosphate oxidase family protein [Acidimicrobiia bacterium]|jgi:PPOX class probable F420-dependent enzyme|nr:pyridoxamine 5'-phosphate oxidase family protein [Acidimicrobiia bacterium]